MTDMDVFEQLKTAATKGRRSSLYRWLLLNHDRFLALLNESGKPNWEEIAVQFNKMGLKNLAGRDVSKNHVRSVWIQVRKSRLDKPSRQPVLYKQSGSIISTGKTMEVGQQEDFVFKTLVGDKK